MSRRTFTLSEDFKARANSACFWEAWVAACLARMGIGCTHSPFVLDGKSGSVDLTVHCGDGRDVPAEVKSLNLVFNNASDYPYPTVLVSSLNSWLRSRERAGRVSESTLMSDYILVSRETGAMVWIPEKTQVGISETYDKGRGELYKTVIVPKSNLRDFVDFVEHCQ